MTFDYNQLPKKRMASGALIRNEDNKILIVKPSYRDGWLIPGGIVEANESPLTTCKREIQEELNLTIHINKLLNIDYKIPKSDYLEGLEFIFDGGYLSNSQINQIVLQAEELSAFEFVEKNELEFKLVNNLYLRMLSAIKAADLNTTFYTENGRILF